MCEAINSIRGLFFKIYFNVKLKGPNKHHLNLNLNFYFRIQIEINGIKQEEDDIKRPDDDEEEEVVEPVTNFHDFVRVFATLRPVQRNPEKNKTNKREDKVRCENAKGTPSYSSGLHFLVFQVFPISGQTLVISHNFYYFNYF